jgi:hypothetical protein
VIETINMPVMITMHVNESNLIEKMKQIISSDDMSANQLINAIQENNFQISYSSKKSNKSNKVKNSNDKPIVKRNTTGYMAFNSENRASVVEKAKANLGEGEKYKANETIKTLGAMWSALSDNDKKLWNDKALAINSSKNEPTTHTK